jgi:hypoxanthine phosphoribosyltransferase
MLDELEQIVVTDEEISRRTRELGEEITKFYEGQEVTVVAIINGALFFTADLLRHVQLPVRLDCTRISSYRNETRSLGDPEILYTITLEVESRHVLIIDDILDTGKTLAKITEMFHKLNPQSLRTCVLLEKQGRREVPFEADFVGFKIPDKFVVGYGLDFAERYRNLPCIGVLKPEYQNPPEWA